MEYQMGPHLFVRGGYTYLDAVVRHSFTSDNLFVSNNPNFPGIPVGAYSPLVGARPFRRAPHSGYLGIHYNHSHWNAAFTGTLVSKRDDSDFLSDENGGTSLLLPNRNLDSAYQKLDLSGNYQVNRFFTVTSSIQNLLSQHYSEAFGYPSLPFTFLSGIKITIGGETWK
jgi:iron complex outermembrane receptor protein/vitamin B12 transporter